MSARLEIGVPIFFVLSGFLLFRPWVRAAASKAASRRLRRYARHRVRRIMPAYLVTVLATFAVYTVFTPAPNPGQTWAGLLRNLTLTQIYTDNYCLTYLHQGLTQMWSLAVEVAFYVVLPVLAYLLLVVLCRGRWQPELLLAGLFGLAAVSPLWLIVVHTTDCAADGGRLWLPAHLSWFVGGMALAVLQVLGGAVPRGRGGSVGAGAVPARLARRSRVTSSAPMRGGSRWPRPFSTPPSRRWWWRRWPSAIDGRYARLLGSRPMVWLGEISYEIFLVHVVVMALVLGVVLHWPLFTGSMAVLYVVTLAITIPLAMRCVG